LSLDFRVEIRDYYYYLSLLPRLVGWPRRGGCVAVREGGVRGERAPDFLALPSENDILGGLRRK